MESYFEDDKNNIKNITILTHKKHKEYVPPYYEKDQDTTSSEILSRQRYVDEINKWLNEYMREMNCPIDSIQNKNVCKRIYDELIELIYKEGFELKDKNQFKEDLIHYLYSLSDLD
jgi:hypothetical protein